MAPSLGVPRVLENAAPMERAIADDEAASALGSLLDVNFCTNSAGDGGVVAGGFDLRKLGIVTKVDGKINSTIDTTTRTIDNVVRAPECPCPSLRTEALKADCLREILPRSA